MNESDWNDDFDDNFDEVLRTSVSQSLTRFYNKSPVKESTQEDQLLDRLQTLDVKDGVSKKFITLKEFNEMKNQDDHKTLSQRDFDGVDNATLKAGGYPQRAPSRKKSLRFLDLYKDEEEGNGDFEQLFNVPLSPVKRERLQTRKFPDQIPSSSPSRSTSSGISLNNYSETDYTDNEDFIEGFEIHNNINLLKQYQQRKERALHQAQLEYDNLMKYNSLLQRKVQSTNNITKYLQVPNEDDENFMDGFDPFSSSSFRPKRPDPLRGRMRHSQSSYGLKGKRSMPVMRRSDSSRKLKHSASNYFDVYHHKEYQNPLDSLGDLYTVRKYGDGDELDEFNDLTENQDETLTQQDKKSIRKLINLLNYMEVYSNPKPRRPQREISSPRRAHRKIGLIKQLNNANSEKIYSNKTGDMKYNPLTYKWEGNEVDLSKFESNTTSKPALISSNSLHTITKKKPIGGGQDYQIVGNMVFDPEKLCWVKMGKDQGVEDDNDDDPFKDLDDLPEEPTGSRSKYTRGVSAASVMTTSTVADPRLGTLSEEVPANDTETDPFYLSQEMILKFEHEERKWLKKVRNWLLPGEEYDRSQLYEIRRMVTDNL